MRNVYFTLALLLCFLNGAAQGIIFEKGTFAEVLAKAQKEKKLIFVDFYTDWCGPCKLMDAQVFSRDNVGAFFNANFVNYKINAEKGEGVEIARKYKVSAYPTMFFLSPDGTPAHMIVGSKNEEAFLNEARGLDKAAKYGGILQMRIDFNEGRNDEAFLKDFWGFLPKNDNLRIKVAERYILTAPKEKLMSEENDNISFLGNDEGLIRSFQTWNDEVMYRMLEVFEEKREKNSLSSDYYMGLVFTLELKAGTLLRRAITDGDEETLEKIVKYQQEYRPRAKSRIEGDGDVNVFSGRGMFFASPEFLRLCFMATNRTNPEKFRKEIVPYMGKFVVERPVEPSPKKQKKQKEQPSPQEQSTPQGESRDAQAANLMMRTHPDAYLFNARRAHDIAISTFIGYANYYWRVMPNDKETRERVFSWLKYIASINAYYAKGIVEIAPLMHKIGYRDEAVEILQHTLDKYRELLPFEKLKRVEHIEGMNVVKIVKDIENMIEDIKTDKI